MVFILKHKDIFQLIYVYRAIHRFLDITMILREIFFEFNAPFFMLLPKTEFTFNPKWTTCSKFISRIYPVVLNNLQIESQIRNDIFSDNYDISLHYIAGHS